MKKEKNGTQIKQIVIYILILYAIFTAVPAVVYGISKGFNQQLPPADSVSAATPAPEVSGADNTGEVSAPKVEESPLPDFLDGVVPQTLTTQGSSTAAVFRILDQSTGTVLTVSESEFLPAAIACELSPTAPEEALKAQAVAAYTFYSRQRSAAADETVDFTCDTAAWQIYTTREQLQARWGEEYETYYARVQAAAEAVAGQMLTENGAPICAAYFALSAGSTEAAVNVWGEDLPYLQTVASPGDTLAEGYRSTVTLSAAALQEKLTAAFGAQSPDFSLPKEQWLSNQQTSPAGYTTTIDCGGLTVSGSDFRTALSLSSAHFTYTYTAPNFTFSVSGRGHGVGMSQTGAMYMAEQGSDYAEILAYFYPGTVLETIGK